MKKKNFIFKFLSKKCENLKNSNSKLKKYFFKFPKNSNLKNPISIKKKLEKIHLQTYKKNLIQKKQKMFFKFEEIFFLIF